MTTAKTTAESAKTLGEVGRGQLRLSFLQGSCGARWRPRRF